MKISKIILATYNKHKVKEITDILGTTSVKFLTLDNFNTKIDIDENGKTLEENSLIKAEAIFKNFGIPTIADDTGLFVNALNGEPGVYSARYAGSNATYFDNCNKLLNKLSNIKNRNAYFKTVICFYYNQNKYDFFEGKCNGKIINEFRGKNGFGYDPLFIPENFHITFAEMPDEKKNQISHRALALKNFKKYMEQNYFLNQK